MENTEEVRRVVKEEVQILQQVKDSEEKIKALEKQILAMVDRSEIEKKESLIASLEEQIEETKNDLAQKDNHPAMVQTLLNCPECRERLISRGMKDIFQEDPEKFKKLVCDSTGCRWVFTAKEETGSDVDIVDALFPKEKEAKSGFRLGVGGGGDE